MTQDLLTIDELAEKLNVRKSWLYSRTREKVVSPQRSCHPAIRWVPGAKNQIQEAKVCR